MHASDAANNVENGNRKLKLHFESKLTSSGCTAPIYPIPTHPHSHAIHLFGIGQLANQVNSGKITKQAAQLATAACC